MIPSTPSSAGLAGLASPPLKSPTPNDSPHLRASPSIPKNYHPYLIQTTSSSLLTRSNSSPSQPVAELRHKSSRSMSSLAASASEGELDKVANGGAGGGLSREERERRRRSMESPLTRPGMRRSGTLPVFPRVEEVMTPTKGMDLPMDPKLWSPSELANYLVYTLRTGGPDGSGQTLPGPLVKDIETWVLRQQVNGRAFLKGNQESWTSSSRPPPFLPLLLSISRRLRRSSLQSRLSVDKTSFSPSPLNSDVPRTGSTLFEEDEDGDGYISPVSGVRRMANAYESNASTPNLDEEPEPLKAQWTGGSSTSEVWRRWEDMGVGVRRNRRDSTRSLGAGNMADEEASPAMGSVPLSSGSGDEGEISADIPYLDEDEGPGGTVKGPPMGLGLGLGVAGLGAGEAGGKGKQTSPPPPYRSPDPDASPAQLVVPLEQASDTPPNRMRLSVTPTPERPRIPSSAQTDDAAQTESSPSPTRDSRAADGGSPHMSNMSTHRSSGSDPYAALRQPSSTGRRSRRLPQELRVASGGGEDSASTSRRVTIRPNRVDSLFAPPSPPIKSPREAELEDQLSQLVSRVKELESRLESVSDEVSRKGHMTTPSSPTGREMTRPGSPVGMLSDSILARLGLLPEAEGLPVRIRQLPGYLFLVGVGVGAVVVRVFMRRR